MKDPRWPGLNRMGSIVVSFFEYQAVICKAELGVSWFLHGGAGDAGSLTVE